MQLSDQANSSGSATEVKTSLLERITSRLSTQRTELDELLSKLNTLSSILSGSSPQEGDADIEPPHPTKLNLDQIGSTLGELNRKADAANTHLHTIINSL